MVESDFRDHHQYLEALDCAETYKNRAIEFSLRGACCCCVLFSLPKLKLVLFIFTLPLFLPSKTTLATLPQCYDYLVRI